MSAIPESEIVAYEIVRQRIRKLAEKDPRILEIPIADAERKCPACHHAPVLEHPSGGMGYETFTCRSCGLHYTQAQSSSPDWRSRVRRTWNHTHGKK